MRKTAKADHVGLVPQTIVSTATRQFSSKEFGELNPPPFKGILLAMRFTFCPACGSRGVTQTSLQVNACSDCGMVLYQNVATATALILECRGRILVTVRNHDPGRDLLGLPGGFAGPGESAEGSLKREVREEIGVELAEIRYFCSFPNTYPFKGVTYHSLDLFFAATLDQEPVLEARDGEVKEFLWLPRTEIDLGRFAFSSMRQALTRYLQTAGRYPQGATPS